MRLRTEPQLPGVALAQPDDLYYFWTVRGTKECLGLNSSQGF
jgi:hypothetical protein